MQKIIAILFLAFLFSCSNDVTQVSLYLEGTDSEELTYGIEKLRDQLENQGVELLIADDPRTAQLLLQIIEQRGPEVNDGFNLTKKEEAFVLSAESRRGLLYGLLDISEQIESGKKWTSVSEKKISAHYPFRAIKFNLPWFSYRSGENLSLHESTCKDLSFWESFLDMMVENKFNTLTLWNLHPYMYMVKPVSFPEAAPFTDGELAEWQSFWKSLFKMAKVRGIDTYIFNWNIFVSEEFSKAYNMAEYSNSSGFLGEGETNELIEQYTREMVTQTINEYEDLTGIGITLGERMGGMNSEERKDWIDRTLIAGLKEADREVRLFYRAPLSAGLDSGGSTSVSTERITRNAIENIGLDQDVWLGFKFNWSHAHSSPKLSIVHGGMLTDTYWEPNPTNYKAVWTMRNEDFHALRWAQPDFIRSFMEYNSQDYVGGCIIGSETYIPAKDYITQEKFQSWDYAFERQWLFYKVWGNLLYNDQTPDSYFADALAKKFNLPQGEDLLKAWKLASMNANRLASFFQGTWDATLYTEGFTKVGGKFIDLDDFITHPVLDSSYVNIQDFVKGNFTEEKITPIELAEKTEQESRQALDIVKGIRESQEVSSDLEIELNDIEAWCQHGFYFGQKLRGGVALERYRVHGAKEDQEKAVEHLTQALSHWKELTEAMEKYNVPTFPYQFDPEFSWRKHIADAENDIRIAEQ